MSLFGVGDLVSWSSWGGKKEFGIVLNKRVSVLSDTDDLFVSFFSSKANYACWYSAKYFILVSSSEKQNHVL